MPDLRERLLHRGFQRFDGTFAGGQQANNKFDFETVYDDPSLYAEVVRQMGALITDSCTKPDLIIPVPRGANRLGRDLACSRGVAALILQKDPGSRAISYSGDPAVVDSFERIAIIEDVPNRLTSVRRVMDLPGIAARTVAVFGVLDRGDPAVREPLPPDVHLQSLVEEYIPSQLPADSALWAFADN